MTDHDSRDGAQSTNDSTGDSGGFSRRSVLKATGAAAVTAGFASTLMGSAAAVGIDTPQLHRDGNLLRDPSDNKVILRGVNIADPARCARSWRGKDAMGVFDKATNTDESNDGGWYNRIIRIPTQPQDIADAGTGSVGSMPHNDDWGPLLPGQIDESDLETYFSTYVDPLVDAAEERGLYVMIDYHRHFPIFHQPQHESDIGDYQCGSETFPNDLGFCGERGVLWHSEEQASSSTATPRSTPPSSTRNCTCTGTSSPRGTATARTSSTTCTTSRRGRTRATGGRRHRCLRPAKKARATLLRRQREPAVLGHVGRPRPALDRHGPRARGQPADHRLAPLEPAHLLGADQRVQRRGHLLHRSRLHPRLDAAAVGLVRHARPGRAGVLQRVRLGRGRRPRRLQLPRRHGRRVRRRLRDVHRELPGPPDLLELRPHLGALLFVHETSQDGTWEIHDYQSRPGQWWQEFLYEHRNDDLPGDDATDTDTATATTTAPGTATPTPTPTDTPNTPTDTPAANALVVNDYDGDPAWSSNQNDLGQWCGAGSFQNGSGEVSDGALVLEYDNGGWFQEQINQDVSDYSTLILRVSGANGGEESEVLFDMGGVRTMLSNVTDDSIGTSASDVAVDLESAGVDRTSSSLSLRLNFWQGGASTLTIEEIRLE
ncbi:hypothetical protein ACFQL4_04425 [Halosimplex aquaticum]